MRIEQVTFTRFIGALIVVTTHYGQPFINQFFGDTSFIFREIPGIVSYFHVLSGFIIMVAYGQPKKDRPFDVKRFFINRFARSYPLYILSLIALVAVFLYIKSPVNFYSLPINVFLLQSWIPGNVKTFNIVAWSISVEVVFYILFPFILNKVFKKLNLLQIGTFCVFLWSAVQFCTNYLLRDPSLLDVTGINHEFIFYNPLMHIQEFLIGNLTAFIYLNHREQFKGNEVILCFLVITVILAFIFPVYGTYHNGFLCLLFSPLLLLFSSCSGRITSLFQHKSFLLLGESSFALYILQIPCYLVCRIILPQFNIQGDIASFPFFLAILLGVSIFSFLYIETPSRNIVKKILKG